MSMVVVVVVDSTLVYCISLDLFPTARWSLRAYCIVLQHDVIKAVSPKSRCCQFFELLMLCWFCLTQHRVLYIHTHIPIQHCMVHLLDTFKSIKPLRARSQRFIFLNVVRIVVSLYAFPFSEQCSYYSSRLRDWSASPNSC